jgi:prepilin-type N-terminal cleavage/methylation domain-containing protein
MAVKNKIQRKRTAFSMVELSIVLAIVAIIISSAVTVSTSAIKNAKVKSTKERMTIIENALALYVATNKRLPCPARLDLISTDSSYGLEAGAKGTCTTTGITEGGIGGTALVYGMAPVRTLGLKSEMGSDGFDNKFSYIVSQHLTDVCSDVSPSNCFGVAAISEGGDNAIEIEETLSGSAEDITRIAAYVILSHGPDGAGGFNKNGTVQNDETNSVTDEDNNLVAVDATDFSNNNFIVTSNDAGFDDIVLYNTRSGIIAKASIASGGSFSTNICLEETSSYYDNEISQTISFPASAYSPTAYVNGNTDCATFFKSSNNPNALTSPARKCNANGVWGPVEYPCIP